MPKPKYAKLTGSLVRRGIATRRVRIIDPEGGFTWADMPYETEIVYQTCGCCGQPIAS